MSAHDSLLLILADAVDDLERLRIAGENRSRSLAEVKGLALSPEREVMDSIVGDLLILEKQAVRTLERAMRAHPLGPWQRDTKGVGAKQLGRLLAAIGDPADRPNVAKLWQYCGHGDPARSHLRKGQPVEHSPVAKMRVRLIAKSAIRHRCMFCIVHGRKIKAEGCEGWVPPPPQCECAEDGYIYRVVYDRERLKWQERDVGPAHREAHALRVVGKELLEDLWVEARNLRA